MNRRHFLRRIGALSGSALLPALPGCGGSDPLADAAGPVEFRHGVASGDPLPDRVILWTRVTPELEGPVRVRYRVAIDPAMTQLRIDEQVITDASRDYTVKVDPVGLEPGTSYYYQFESAGSRSPLGRTRTTPVAAIDRLRLVALSCAKFSSGFYNVYRAVAARADVDAVLHLGDYIYESGSDGASQSPTTPPADFVAVSFNTGIPQCSRAADAAYSCDDADIAGEWYGTGLSFKVLVDEAQAFFDGLQPDVVAFQEMFYSGECPDIPPEFHPGFVCEDWQPGDPSVAQLVLGPDYQIACNLGKPDKCLAVKKTFGTWRACDGDLCLDRLDGATVAGCGGGSRIGRGVLDLRGGGQITVVNVHGTSGILRADQDCRVRQFEQIFVDLGDGSGEPAANGARNLNTDPGRMFWDASAASWNAFVGDGTAFRFVTDVGRDAEPSYAGLFNIDHMVSDTLQGHCTGGEVTDIAAFDHMPIVCFLAPQVAASTAPPPSGE